jgi:hypothetical protein
MGTLEDLDKVAETCGIGRPAGRADGSRYELDDMTEIGR